MGESFNFTTGEEAVVASQNWDEQKEARSADEELQKRKELLETFNTIKIGDTVSFKDSNEKLVQGYIVKEKHEADLTVDVGTQNEGEAFVFLSTIPVASIIDPFTPKPIEEK